MMPSLIKESIFFWKEINFSRYIRWAVQPVESRHCCICYHQKTNRETSERPNDILSCEQTSKILESNCETSEWKLTGNNGINHKSHKNSKWTLKDQAFDLKLNTFFKSFQRTC